MDSNNVLQKYVELCNNQQSDQISLCFASNGVVDWYGRTLKGPRKIADFFRYNNQYCHNFANGKQCSPFESRESHTSTKQIPPENLTVHDEESTLVDSVEVCSNNVPSTSKNDSKGFLTPPQQDIPTPMLPALTQGRVFRKMSSSDDDEDDGLCSVMKFKETLHDAVLQKSDLLELDSHDATAGDESSLSRKRHVNESEEGEEPIPRKRLKEADCDSGVAEGGDCDQLSDLYTELKYIEAFGCLDVIQKTKHRGVHTPSTSQTDGDTMYVSSHFDDRLPDETTDGHLVRQTKLNISYRLHRNCKDIQFALIVYEHLTKRPTTRRNLINDFGSIEIESASKSTPLRRKNADKNRKSLTAKKPLRF